MSTITPAGAVEPTSPPPGSSNDAANVTVATSTTAVAQPTAPANFSWVVPDLLAGSGFPSTHGHLQYLVDSGVDILVTLNAERKPPVDTFNSDELWKSSTKESAKMLEWINLDVDNSTAPTMDQIQLVVQKIEEAEKKEKKVGVHCTMGRGRTGTFIAAWLAKSKGLSAEDAIRLTRELRPGSVETTAQENVIKDYVKLT